MEASESNLYDDLKFQKEKGIATFNRRRTINRFRQMIEVAFVFAGISWCTSRAPAIFKSTGAILLEFNTCLSNHHVVFLIGNAIIVLLLMLCRRSDADSPAVRRYFYDDYVKYSEAARATPPPQQQDSEGFDGDEAAAAIEKAARQIRRFQRTQSEVLKREISVRERKELRRSETESGREKLTETAGIENLSNEEFRRRVDAFIHKHWSKRGSEIQKI